MTFARPLGSLRATFGLHLQLKKNLDLVLHLHSDEDEFWIQFSYFPTFASKIFLTINSLENVSIGVLHLTEKEVVRLDQVHAPCKEFEGSVNPQPAFVDCYKTYFKKSINRTELSCFIPGCETFIQDKKLPECSNLSDARAAHDLLNGVKWSLSGQVPFLALLCKHINFNRSGSCSTAVEHTTHGQVAMGSN